MTRVRHLDDAELVAATLRDVRLDPVVDTVLLTVLDRCLTEPAAFPERHWWIAEDDDAGVVGVAFRTPPWPLGLALESGPWLDDLVGALLDGGSVIEDVQAERARAEAFAAAWTRRSGGTWSAAESQRLLRCVDLVPPVGVEGRARQVQLAERELLVDWLEAFGAELDLFRHDNETLADSLLGRAYWWVDADDQRVSFASYRRPQRGVSRVGPVYTPPEHRRHGYAAAVTGAVTEAAYSEGAEQVILYTDAANPTSNAVYARIGYVHESDAVHLRYEAPNA